ncbi:MAG TPA: AarF/ABC1/UbiB kinase family protein [Thermoguttaceae bacterium]|nr:AarF/ABC1/UbiB kinase family protein [Thermoguttaceae bacterium]
MKISSIPQIYRHLGRWGEILSVLSKYGLANWISRLGPDFAKDLLKAPGGAAIARHRWETRLRLALGELGPTFIKLGQVLSTRPDLVGVDLADELQHLQTEVPGDPPEKVRETIESELGRPMGEVFDQFDEQPMASASIGQVHRARLKERGPVAVKVQHTDIERKVLVDLEILSGLAQLSERIPEFQNYRPMAIVTEFRRVLRRELDFRREVRHMEQFARDFARDPTVHIPRPYPELCTNRVLVMELVEGIKLSETERLASAGFDLDEVARRGANLYLEMIFVHSFYHADPHPGNVVLLDDNVIGLLDFGMVGRIDERLHEDIEEMLLAVASQDAEHLTAIVIRVGAVPQDLDRSALSLDMADFIAHYGGQPLENFDLSGALKEMTEMIRQYRISLPARIAVLIKVLVSLEGSVRLLSPHFSLLEVMQPYRRKMLLRRLSPRRRIRKMRRFYAQVEHMIEALPRGVVDILEQVQSGKFDVHLDHRGLEPSVNRLVLGMLASALFLGSALLVSRNVPPLVENLPLMGWIPAIQGVSVPGIVGIAFSLALGLRLWRAINKSGHLERRR